MSVKRHSILALLMYLLILAQQYQCACQPMITERLHSATKYRIASRFPLTLAANGIDGYLELRLDKRLTKKIIAFLWQTGNDDFDDDAALSVFKDDPPHQALIEVVSEAGKVIQSEELERSLARLHIEHLYGDARQTYFLTIDYSNEFGSYSGPVTSLLEVRNGHTDRLRSTGPNTSRQKPIELMKSLKTTWKVINAPNSNSKQILLASCRPNWSYSNKDPDFWTTYSRFYFDSGRWLMLSPTVKAYSDFKRGIPSRSHFP